MEMGEVTDELELALEEGKAEEYQAPAGVDDRVAGEEKAEAKKEADRLADEAKKIGLM